MKSWGHVDSSNTEYSALRRVFRPTHALHASAASEEVADEMECGVRSGRSRWQHAKRPWSGLSVGWRTSKLCWVLRMRWRRGQSSGIWAALTWRSASGAQSSIYLHFVVSHKNSFFKLLISWRHCYRTRLVHAAAAGLDTEAYEAEHAEAGLLQGQWAALQSNARLLREGLRRMVNKHQQVTDVQVRSNGRHLQACGANEKGHMADQTAAGPCMQAAQVKTASESLLERIRSPGLEHSSLAAPEEELVELRQKAHDVAALQRLLGAPVTLYAALQMVCGKPCNMHARSAPCKGASLHALALTEPALH